MLFRKQVVDYNKDAKNLKSLSSKETDNYVMNFFKKDNPHNYLFVTTSFDGKDIIHTLIIGHYRSNISNDFYNKCLEYMLYLNNEITLGIYPVIKKDKTINYIFEVCPSVKRTRSN